MKMTGTRVFIVVLLGLVAGGAYYFWQLTAAVSPPQVTQAPTAAQPITATSEPAPNAAPASSAPAIAHPIAAAEAPQAAPAPTLPALAESDSYVVRALAGLLGQQGVQTFLLNEGFVRHVVATVDNLPRGHASWTVWPVNRTPGRFTSLRVESANSQYEIISTDNAARYVPFVKFIEAVDTAKAVALYVQLYPLFQQAYEELGYPGKYFNDRLVAVIDHLLATQLITDPIKVQLVDVKGSVKSLQPWTRYEFADPALEALSAGQKMLLRVGPSNQQRLQAKLKDFRAKIVNSAASR
jgi:hypothetical protein